MHPPPSPAQANFTLMSECTPESRRYYSVYSVVVTKGNEQYVPLTVDREQGKGWSSGQ